MMSTVPHAHSVLAAGWLGFIVTIVYLVFCKKLLRELLPLLYSSLLAVRSRHEPLIMPSISAKAISVLFPASYSILGCSEIECEQAIV